MTNEYLQLGTVAIIFILAIREFFSYLKSRKNNGSKQVMEEMLKELRALNENHLHDLKNTINEGNNRIVDTISNGNIKQIEILSEIRGNLKK